MLGSHHGVVDGHAEWAAMTSQGLSVEIEFDALQEKTSVTVARIVAGESTWPDPRTQYLGRAAATSQRATSLRRETYCELRTEAPWAPPDRERASCRLSPEYGNTPRAAASARVRDDPGRLRAACQLTSAAHCYRRHCRQLPRAFDKRRGCSGVLRYRPDSSRFPYPGQGARPGRLLQRFAMSGGVLRSPVDCDIPRDHHHAAPTAKISLRRNGTPRRDEDREHMTRPNGLP
jgi:hypothetical protein